MLHINDLPTLVIRQILVLAINNTGEFVQGLEYGFVYIQICRLWRHVGCPLVHHTLFFEYNDYNSLVHPDTPWITNIDLIYTSGYNRSVTKISFGLYILNDSQLSSIKPMLELINMGPIGWPQDLEFLLRITAIRNQEYESLPQVVCNQVNSCIKDIVVKFARAFPNVTNMSIYSRIKGQPIDMFFTELIGFYSCQIRSLYVYSEVRAALTNPLPQLRDIVLDTGGPISLTKIGPSSLKMLDLRMLSNTFPWEHFQVPPDSSNIAFSSLKRLNLFIGPQEEAILDSSELSGSAPATISFPSLACLKVRNETHELVQPFPSMMVPKHLPVITVSDTLAAIQQMLSLNIRSVGNLYVSLHRPQKEDIPNQFYTVTNHIFNRMSIAEYSSFKFSGIQYELDVSQIQWQNLNSLELQFLDDESIMELLLKLLSLQFLEIHTIDSSGLQWNYPSIYSAEDIEGTMDCVCNSRLTDIKLLEFSEDWAIEDAANFLFALMAAHRKLRKITIQDEIEEEVVRNMEKAKPDHPHLKSVSVHLVSEINVKVIYL